MRQPCDPRRASQPDDPRGREDRRRVRLVVVYGGQSAEHEVSCISAFHVLAAADPGRYDVRVVGITSDGAWLDATAAARALPAGQASLPSPDTLVRPSRTLGPSGPGALPPTRDPAGPVPAPGTALAAAAGGAEDDHAPVVVFPLLHGPKGEDGTVQGLLEVAGLPYVGAGVAGSAASMDKGLTKAVLAAAGLPQARHLVLREQELDELTPKQVEAELGWPVFVKPANLGSSIGISLARDRRELEAAMALARRYDEWLVVEERVEAREIEVGILGYGADLRASVPGEIRPSHEFYDFEDKYLAGTSTSVIPADLPAEITDATGALARQAARALRVDGMARIDFFYEEPGRGLLVNEVNTIPGFTPISQYPQLWAASGVSYPELVDELVRLALRRHERRRRFEARRLS